VVKVSMDRIVRVIKFVDTDGRELMRIYLHGPNAKDLSFFTAYVKKQLAVRALQYWRAQFEDKGNFVIFEDNEDEILRKLVIFAGVAESMRWLGESEYELKRLLEFVGHMAPVEMLFWFSRFVYAHENYRRDVRRVAKAFRILYGF
jgi:hypothetical protein